MPAYAILNIDIYNDELIKEYKSIGPDTVEAYSGKFIVRGGETSILEGKWIPNRLVIIEFPSKDIAEKWWHSAEYQKAKSIREKAANTDLVIIDGV